MWELVMGFLLQNGNVLAYEIKSRPKSTNPGITIVEEKHYEVTRATSINGKRKSTSDTSTVSCL